jgi:FKBP-type peptidyl-prolyl cis-trans isomerase
LQICSYSFSGAGNGVIPANADLVFEMTLVALKKKVNIEITKNVTCTSDQKTRDKDTVEFNYIGKLVNGIFDKSFCVSS